MDREHGVIRDNASATKNQNQPLSQYSGYRSSNYSFKSLHSGISSRKKYFIPELYETESVNRTHNEKPSTPTEVATTLIFKYLMIITSLQFCVANGSHNVANAISPLLNIFDLYGFNKDVSLLNINSFFYCS